MLASSAAGSAYFPQIAYSLVSTRALWAMRKTESARSASFASIQTKRSRVFCSSPSSRLIAAKSAKACLAPRPSFTSLSAASRAFCRAVIAGSYFNASVAQSARANERRTPRNARSTFITSLWNQRCFASASSKRLAMRSSRASTRIACGSGGAGGVHPRAAGDGRAARKARLRTSNRIGVRVERGERSLPRAANLVHAGGGVPEVARELAQVRGVRRVGICARFIVGEPALHALDILRSLDVLIDQAPGERLELSPRPQCELVARALPAFLLGRRPGDPVVPAVHMAIQPRPGPPRSPAGLGCDARH